MNAKQIIDDFPTNLNGRVMLGLEAAELLVECVAEVEGDYVEIGSGFGGSAVLAGMAGAYLICCIDPFIGMNRVEGQDIMYATFLNNIHHFGIEQDVLTFRQSCPPFPEALHFHQFTVGLIDGDHDGQHPYRDFLELDDRVTEYLLFDNAGAPPVERTIEAAINGGNWEEYKTVEYESTCDAKKGEIVSFTALQRIGAPQRMKLVEKMQYYGGTNIPLL